MRNNLLTALICLFFLFSCKKEKHNDFINAKFKASSITKDGTLKVFTENGEIITDQNVIAAFTANEDLLLSLDKRSAEGEGIKFVSADSVYFLNPNGTTFGKYAYKIDGANIFFYETIEGFIDGLSSSVHDKIVKFQPTFSEQYTIPGVGGLYTYKRRTNTVKGYITKDELKINQFSFKLRRTQDKDSWQEHSSTLMNVFNEDYLKTLTKQDMLAVQSYSLNFKRSN